MNGKSTYYLIGLGCGTLAGLLFAPKPGATTRAHIVKAGKKQRRMVTAQISSAAVAMRRSTARALRALKRTAPVKRVQALVG
jgi:gas vesicle protein